MGSRNVRLRAGPLARRSLARCCCRGDERGMRVIPTRGGGRTRGEYRATPLAAPPPRRCLASALPTPAPSIASQTEPHMRRRRLCRHRLCRRRLCCRRLCRRHLCRRCHLLSPPPLVAASSCRRRLGRHRLCRRRLGRRRLGRRRLTARVPRHSVGRGGRDAGRGDAAASGVAAGGRATAAAVVRQMTVAECARGRGVGRLIAEASRDGVLCKNRVS